MFSNDCECKNRALVYPNCNPCGDGTCDKNLENCVTCPQDCSSTSCDLCGDHFCSATENCNTCYQDCNCTMECSPACVPGQGTCVSGICSCNHPFTGPSCSNVSQPIIIDNDNSTPSVSMKVQGLNSAKFYISLLEVYEKDVRGEKFNSVDLTKANYSLTVSNTNTYTFWNYSTILHQTTDLNIYIYYFNATTNNFEGNLTVAANTIKLALSIKYWPFKAIQNSLYVVFSNDISNSDDQPVEACQREDAKNQEENLRWYKITVEGLSLYAQLEEYALLDGRNQAITYASTSPTNTTIKIPFFWSNLTLDPNFGVLLASNDECSKVIDLFKSKQKWQLYLLAIPIVAVCLLIGFLIWKYESFRLWNRFRARPKLVIEVDQHDDL